MAISVLSLVDADGNTYTFPADFYLTNDSWGVTSNMKNIPFAHGGRDLGDGCIEARTFMVEGALRADTEALLETKVRAWRKAVLSGGKLYVSGDVVTRYITVRGAVVDSRYIGSYKLEKTANVSFLCEYPFWEDNTLSSGGGVVTDGDDVVVDNSASDTFVLPVITIEADQSVDVPAFLLRSLSDGGSIFEYQDPNFKQGDTVVIDSKAGTVKRNGNSTIEYVTQCRFTRLQNMAAHTIRYEGASVTLTVEFREVYL